MIIKGDSLYYFLEGKNLTPELKRLKREFDNAVQEWNRAWNDLESENLSVTSEAIERLNSANRKIAELKTKIQEEKATQN